MFKLYSNLWSIRQHANSSYPTYPCWKDSQFSKRVKEVMFKTLSTEEFKKVIRCATCSFLQLENKEGMEYQYKPGRDDLLLEIYITFA